MASSTEMALFHTKMENFTDDYFNYLDFNETVMPTSATAVKEQLLSMSHIYLPMLYFFMFFAGFTGNLFVIIIIGNRHKKNARLVDTFVQNLALADLVFVFTLPLWAISAGKYDHWPFGELLCKVSSYIITVNRFSNIFFLTCMSVDRYLAIVRLMDSHFLRSSKCIHLTCGVVWGSSLILGTPSLVYRKLNVESASCIDDLESSFFQGMILLTVFLTFVLPVMIILLCYGSIMVKLRNHWVTAGNSRAEARCRHSLKIVFTIITVFLISWLPYNVLKTIQVISKISNVKLDDDTYKYLARGLIISSCLAFLNSCLNPVIYLFLDKHFRRSAAAQCKFCMGKGDVQQSYMSSNSTASNGISESLGSTAIRGHITLTQK
ncbi:probable G-protein coupled receptor 25 [Neoarius graeffei]|uniref:probable G-protein coupled receptor 25 n=1 Tax=Neoarius graeffei TaxID=443677 RepID=UPI00298D1F9D|nr:probable G-protein coupled receptor 25 [Neoarius graeffei]